MACSRWRVPFLAACLGWRGEGWCRRGNGGEGAKVEEGQIWVGNMRFLTDRAGPHDLFFPPTPPIEPHCDGFGLKTPDDFSAKSSGNRDNGVTGRKSFGRRGKRGPGG